MFAAYNCLFGLLRWAEKKNVSGMFIYGTDFPENVMPNITVISLLNTK